MARRPHRHCHPSRPGQGGETTDILVLDPGRDLGVQGAHPFEEDGSDLGPKGRVRTADYHQALGNDPGLPCRRRRYPPSEVDSHHGGDPGVLGEKTETEPGHPGAKVTDHLDHPTGLEMEHPFPTLLEERCCDQVIDAQANSTVGRSIISNMCSMLQEEGA